MMWFAAGMDPRALAFSGGGAVLLCAGAGPIQCYDHVTATLTGLYKDLTYHQFEVHRLSVGGNYLAFDQVDPKEGLLSEWKPNCRFQVWSLPMFLDASRNQITKH
jgi:hypothetical protein